MNYEIPEDEVENFLAVYWQMLVSIENSIDPKKDILDAVMVEGGYELLNRAGVINKKPYWK